MGLRTLGGAAASLALMLVLYVFAAGLSYGSMVGTVEAFGRLVGYLEFLAPGLASVAVAETSFLTGSLYWIDRRTGMFEQLIAGPFTRGQYVASKMLTAVAYSVAYTVFTAALLAPLSPGMGLGLLRAAAAAPLASAVFASMGLLLATTLGSAEAYNMLVNVTLVPLFLLSPAYYPLAAMPGPVRLAALANPLTYAVEAMRGLALAPGHAARPLAVLAASAAALAAMAAARLAAMEVVD